MSWYNEAIFYHIYPLGLTGAPKENDYGTPVHRLNTLLPWIDHIKEIGCTALYIGPLFESVGHGYETTDYKKLDSRLGTNKDLTNFVKACHEKGIANVAVTAGYIHPDARRDFFAVMDAANVDLKAFTDDFYVHQCGGHLAPVLDTLSWLHHETDVWVEITTLLIPGLNDSDTELTALAKWVATEMGPDVPLHFTAFHPDYKLDQLPPTPPATLRRARQIARDAGLHYVYTGNIEDPDGQTTYCPNCKSPVIRRDRYTIDSYDLDAEGRCRVCGTQIPGRFGGSSVVDQSFRLPHRVAIR